MQHELNKMYLSDTNTNDYDYSKFTELNDFILDEELKAKFLPIAKKLNLTQESVELLLDLALEMSKKQKFLNDQDKNNKIENEILKYSDDFKNDKEIPNNNSEKLKEYMSIASSAFSEFCSEKLKEIFKESGLIYHPELIKMFYKIGDLAQEDNISYYGKPSYEEPTPAQILYGPREN